MKVGVLFSGGKDSCMSAWIAKKKKHELSCLITLESENPDSYMFHTPSISKTKLQAKVMNLPLIIKKTKGIKEEELKDLEAAINAAIAKYEIQGIVTGALYSEYQRSRIKEICKNLGVKCLNPLWHKNEIKYLNELIKNKFEVIITGIAAYPLDASWLGKVIDRSFVKEAKQLQKEHQIHPAGEGGEFETFVVNCPLFERRLNVTGANFTGEDHSWKMEIDVE
jgi:ABC transporter with metal-binding/Fe-S-binding domain ATP-binding protein